MSSESAGESKGGDDKTPKTPQPKSAGAPDAPETQVKNRKPRTTSKKFKRKLSFGDDDDDKEEELRPKLRF